MCPFLSIKSRATERAMVRSSRSKVIVTRSDEWDIEDLSDFTRGVLDFFFEVVLVAVFFDAMILISLILKFVKTIDAECCCYDAIPGLPDCVPCYNVDSVPPFLAVRGLC